MMSIDVDLERKADHASSILRSLDSVIVAFSGGADSTLVAALAARALGPTAVAAIDASPSLPRSELASAREVARTIGIDLAEIVTNEVDDPAYASNPVDRCFHCKDALFRALDALARERGIRAVVDGYNADDAGELLHGRRAANVYGVRSPLYEAGLTKAEVRALSRMMALPTWDKPAAACLASRFPTGRPITLDGLRQVEHAEEMLRALGCRGARVRHHGDIARIEVSPDQFDILIHGREDLVRALRDLGFRHVALDLDGYRRGSVAARLEPLTLASPGPR